MHLNNMNITSYGRYSSSNYGAHTQLVTFPQGKVWFSYETPIAFLDFKSGKKVVTQNIWNNTTGKHLNWINPDKKSRVPNDVFNEQLQKYFGDIVPV